MDVGCGLLIIFITQSRLHPISAELQVEDIVGTLDDVIQTGLQEMHKDLNVWHTFSAIKQNYFFKKHHVCSCVNVIDVGLSAVNKE